MTIFNPLLKPELMKSHEVNFGTSISSYLWKKVINNYEWVNKSIPIGFVLFFHSSTTDANSVQIEKPNSNIWKLLDGSTINDVNSPLNGQTLPDLRNKFLKGSNTYALTGGQNTINLAHDHGGITGSANNGAGGMLDSGGDAQTGAPHTHPIYSAWPSSETIIPQHIELQLYIRYK